MSDWQAFASLDSTVPVRAASAPSVDPFLASAAPPAPRPPPPKAPAPAPAPAPAGFDAFANFTGL